MIKTFKNSKMLYITGLLLLFIIALSVVTTKYLSVIAMAIFALFCVVSPVTHSYALLFALLPFANIFKMEAGMTSFFTVCEILVVLVSIVKAKKIKVGFFLSAALLTAYMLIADVKNFELLTVIKVIIGIALLYFIVSAAKKEDVVNISYMLSISVIIMLLLSQWESYYAAVEPFLSDLDYVLNDAGNASDIVRNGGLLGDPNYCAVLIVLSVALLSVLYYYKSIGVEFWLLVGFLIPMGLFTYSKSYFLCIAVLITFLIVFILIPRHRRWAVVVICGLFILGILVIGGRIELFNVILGRFSKADLTSGRTTLNEQYLEHIFSSSATLFFGDGISVDRIATATNNVHNIYIELLFKLGLIGSAIYIVALANAVCVKNEIKAKRHLVDYIPLLFLLVMYYFLAGVNAYELPFYIAIAVLSIKYSRMGNQAIPQTKKVTR